MNTSYDGGMNIYAKLKIKIVFWQVLNFPSANLTIGMIGNEPGHLLKRLMRWGYFSILVKPSTRCDETLLLLR